MSDGAHKQGTQGAKGDVARLQNFSDAVFALSATLLVVSVGEVPRNYDELLASLAGFPAFAITFAALISLWYSHRQFFSRFPVGDGVTVAINSVLLFVVLLFVYPLKLLAEVVSESFLGVAPDVTIGMGIAEVRGLLLIFGAAAASTTVSFIALHVRAWQLRDELGLSESQRRELRWETRLLLVLVFVPVLSMAAAALYIGMEWGLPFWIYLLGPLAVPVAVSADAIRHGHPRHRS